MRGTSGTVQIRLRRAARLGLSGSRQAGKSFDYRDNKGGLQPHENVPSQGRIKAILNSLPNWLAKMCLPPQVAAFDGCQLAPRHQQLKRTDLCDDAGSCSRRRMRMQRYGRASNSADKINKIVPRLAHPSWNCDTTRSGHPNGLSADEFWRRLGS